MSSPAMIWNDEIDQGAGFYREVVFYDDKALTVLSDVSNMTIRACLLLSNGTKVADFACSWLEAVGNPGDVGYKPKRIALTLAPSITLVLKHTTVYRYFIDLLNSDNIPNRKQKGELTVSVGI